VSRLFPEPRTVRVDAVPGGLAALRELPPCRLTVVLSNRLVRYLVVPWNDALEGEAEEQAYLRHHFGRIHGERAKEWVFRWSEGLASAVDKTVLEALKSALPRRGKAKLVSIQPELMAAFNRARGAVPPKGAWLVLPDEERACVALHVRGKWLAVQTARGEWQALLERERHRVAGDSPSTVIDLSKGKIH
jgi:hypothetical protein